MPAEKKRRVLAVIFDLDGTLIDTEPLYQRFWVEAARQMGYPMEKHHALMLRSLSPLQAEPLLRREVAPDFDYHGVRALRRQIMEAYTDQHGVRPKPGMEETLRELHDMGIRIGLAVADVPMEDDRFKSLMTMSGGRGGEPLCLKVADWVR